MRKSNYLKALLKLTLCIVMLVFAFGEEASAASLKASGTCGTNLKWYLYDDGNMVINGTGAMKDYLAQSSNFSLTLDRPWEEYSELIETISLGEGITSVGKYAFANLSSLKEVSFASTITSVGERAFEECIVLKELIIPNNVETIGKAALKNCVSLSNVYLSRQISSAPNLFEGCVKLKDVAIPKSMTTISNYMFSGCTSLEEVWFDESVVGIGVGAFKNCTSLKEIMTDYDYTQIKIIDDYAFQNCTSLKDIPLVTEHIGYEAFRGCTKLSTIKIDVPSMEAGAFADCSSISSVQVGETLGVINARVFQNVSSLRRVYILGKTTKIKDTTVFNGCPADMEIKVPSENTEVIQFCNENGIKLYDGIIGGVIGGIDMPVVGVSDTVRLINTNHCTFYTSNNCSVNAVKTEGAVKATSPTATPRDIDIRYSDAVILTESNYQNYSDTASVRKNVGMTKIYVYGEYVEDGRMYCAVAKAEPTINVQNLTLTVGGTKTLKLNVLGNPNLYYKSSNSKVATISSAGKITAKSAGTTIIRIYAEPTDNYRAVVKEFKVTVNKVTPKQQKITSIASTTKAYGSKAFSLNAKTSGNGKLTYKSSNKKVATVSTAGKVTIKGYGTAKITIKAAATSKYKSASKTITIKVVPKKMKLKSVSSPGKKKLNIYWTKDKTVTGYQVQFSTSKKFSSGTYKKTFKASRSYTKITGVPGSKTYYVRIRSYKTVNGTKYYGAWSTVKSVKVK